ncbi:MAG: hypothetical protein Athens101410_676 [Parcubacteria group bacterium Athens1014_10]|nr:MAG: hypothetical protein Athens101410_676 [Parcubacteria group bacterium Athens1014_10]TSD05185.1 MAG: hypothetical protein Athens071412_383 [Parcubacteria group bacterium Athens0714_12]
MKKKEKNEELEKAGYLFSDGKLIEFWALGKKDFGRETGALRIRTNLSEVNVEFIAEKKPTEQQLNTIKELKEINDRNLFFDIIDKNKNIIKECSGFNKSIYEMKKKLINFYKSIRRQW